jgi:hypothetical protein
MEGARFTYRNRQAVLKLPSCKKIHKNAFFDGSIPTSTHSRDRQSQRLYFFVRQSSILPFQFRPKAKS